ALESCTSEAADGLHPAEDFLDELSLTLADQVTGVARSPVVDRRRSPWVAGLRDMRRDIDVAAVADEGCCVVPLVGADGGPSSLHDVVAHHLDGRFTLGEAVGLLDTKVDEEPVPVLHQCVCGVAHA